VSQREGWLKRLAQRLSGKGQVKQASSVSVKVDDSPGWGMLTASHQDYSTSEVQEIYQDALLAWRKNPIAWRIIAITTNFVVGDGIEISSTNRSLNRFVYDFWNHDQNKMDLRLPAMSDELARAGDLFIVLFRNPQDGMSYVRFITKDRIERIETAENDWERELVYFEKQELGDAKPWYSPRHPAAASTEAVMLHYCVNRPIGALLGESDLTSMIPWLQRYSRMLEDRVRIHWALRMFLWFVTVPANALNAKIEQYRNAPESGSVVVKDESEKWEVLAPSVNAADARPDLHAVRQMIDAGSGYPPHWRGDPGEANLATATAMQAPTERHLMRRQQYMIYILKDLLYNAYRRAVEIGRKPHLPSTDYNKLFTAVTPEIGRSDNLSLAQAAQTLSAAMSQAKQILGGDSPLFKRLALQLILRFAGEPQTDEKLDEILTSIISQPEANLASEPQASTLNLKGNEHA
jgi:hypothetical protein